MTHPIIEGMTEAVTMAKLMRENEELRAELEEERALADDLYIGSRGTANQITKAWSAYRKARGM